MIPPDVKGSGDAEPFHTSTGTLHHTGYGM
jgi:hypothetical protein